MERGTKNHRYEHFIVIARNEVTWQSHKDEGIFFMRLLHSVRNDIRMRLSRCARNDKQERIPSYACSEKKKEILLLIRKKEDLYNNERHQSPSRRPQEKIR